MRCPRCQQDLPDALEACPACGVILGRYRPRPLAAGPPERRLETSGPWLLRAGFLLLLAVWTCRLLALPIRGEALMRSVLHLIHLPFHEAGHMLFWPLGDFMHVLGGTLGQLLVPALVLGAFLREGNPFGAAVGAWWLGTSFVDCAPYIDDARAGVLLLISGELGQENREGHDWWNLLHRMDCLACDHTLARACWLLGALLMLAALAWGAVLLWRQARGGDGLNSD